MRTWNKALAPLLAAAMIASPITAHAQSSSSAGDYQPGPGYTRIPQPQPRPAYVPSADNIYRKSQGFEYLMHPGGLTPGGRITNLTRGGFCSVGFIGEWSGRRVITTAGHCGTKGDRFAYIQLNAAGQEEAVPFGQMLLSYQSDSDGYDYGIIDAGNAPYRTTPWKPGYTAGPAAAEEVQRVHPRICRLGYRSGLSCGDFIGLLPNGAIEYYSISDHGDSGGPVYAYDKGKYYPIGMTAYGYETHASHSFATPIDELIRHAGVTIY